MAFQLGVGRLRCMICSAVIRVTSMFCTGAYMDAFMHKVCDPVLWAHLGNLSPELDAHWKTCRLALTHQRSHWKSACCQVKHDVAWHCPGRHPSHCPCLLAKKASIQSWVMDLGLEDGKLTSMAIFWDNLTFGASWTRSSPSSSSVEKDDEPPFSVAIVESSSSEISAST